MYDEKNEEAVTKMEYLFLPETSPQSTEKPNV